MMEPIGSIVVRELESGEITEQELLYDFVILVTPQSANNLSTYLSSDQLTSLQHLVDHIYSESEIPDSFVRESKPKHHKSLRASFLKGCSIWRDYFEAAEAS